MNKRQIIKHIKKQRLPLLLVAFVIMLSVIWSLDEKDIADKPSFTDKVVGGIVNLNRTETIDEQVDEFISSVTPIEPESE
tara:strand:- start:2718 stop:2957 length:240 start_codon:yes stop_codon:yes gene_type:complete